MKYLPPIAVLLGVTAALAAVRGLAWHPADAARSPEPPARVVGGPIDRRPSPEGAALDFVPANAGDVKDGSGAEKLMARLAADCAAHLYEKAKGQPDNVRLLEQAAAHYRACLSHEPTVADAAGLFADARKNLAQIDTALARAAKRDEAPTSAAPKPAEKPVVRQAPAVQAPAAAPKDDAGQMIAPDGTIIRKARPGG